MELASEGEHGCENGTLSCQGPTLAAELWPSGHVWSEFLGLRERTFLGFVPDGDTLTNFLSAPFLVNVIWNSSLRHSDFSSVSEGH